MKNIKAILFDSGKVMNSPISGNWFITANFYKIIDKSVYDTISDKRKAAAFKEAARYVFSENLITTKEEELFHFKRFYEIFSSRLPELNLRESDIEDLANDLVFNPEKYEFFKDALAVVPRLSEKYKLAIVSDAWPSLKDVYDHIGLSQYFDSFVISSILGVTKPDERMYKTALEELNIQPQEAVFVDDSPKNCKGAAELGINAFQLCRKNKSYQKQKLISVTKNYNVIKNLYQLEEILNKN